VIYSYYNNIFQVLCIIKTCPILNFSLKSWFLNKFRENKIMANQKVKALGISSGGLDSILSALVLKDAGVDVKWITFVTPFFTAEKSETASDRYGIPLRVENISETYIKMMKSSDVKYGKNMNPCLHCHTLMFSIAGSLMKEEGADFLFSGEVAGQRPMSQTKNALKYVEKHSGYRGYIVRPLSAGLLPETIPEQKGWIKRSDLCKISGRSRKPQIELAKKYNVSDYPAPAGGCLLTDKIYSKRLSDLMEFQEIIELNDYELLKYGRHLRISPFEKLIVGRDEKENEQLFSISKEIECITIKVLDYPGPFSILRGSGENMFTAGSVCAAYSKAPAGSKCRVMFLKPGSDMELVKEICVPHKSEVSDILV
jgi:tRNA U34 2-thiouridine synthase MnmA/TrmU